MKVVILAGGWGTRLGNRTDLIPKPMVPIGNRPVLWHIMKIYSHYGFDEFVVCLGVKGQVIKDYFLNYEAKNSDFTIDLSNNEINFHSKHEETDWKVSLVDTGLNTLKGGRIKRIEKYLDPEMNMLTYGDGVSDINIQTLVNFHKARKRMVTISGVHPPARFGELCEKDGSLVSFKEKPQTSEGLINGGFMVFNTEMLDLLTTDENCDFEFGILENLANDGKVGVYRHEGNWECMDHERDVVHLNKLWDSDKAFWKVWD